MNVSSNKSSQTKSKPQVSPILVAVVVIALLAFVIWRGMAAFSGPSASKLPPPPAQETSFIEQKAKDCQGDFKKLNREDQDKVQQISHGFGESAMASTYRQLSKTSP